MNITYSGKQGMETTCPRNQEMEIRYQLNKGIKTVYPENKWGNNVPQKLNDGISYTRNKGLVGTFPEPSGWKQHTSETKW